MAEDPTDTTVRRAEELGIVLDSSLRALAQAAYNLVEYFHLTGTGGAAAAEVEKLKRKVYALLPNDVGRPKPPPTWPVARYIEEVRNAMVDKIDEVQPVLLSEIEDTDTYNALEDILEKRAEAAGLDAQSKALKAEAAKLIEAHWPTDLSTLEDDDTGDRVGFVAGSVRTTYAMTQIKEDMVAAGLSVDDAVRIVEDNATRKKSADSYKYYAA